MRKFVTVSLFIAACLVLSMAVAYADETPQTKLEELALPLVGTPYQYGGSTTNAFDCSGFSSYIFGQLGVELTRSSSSQALQGTYVNKSDLRAGDLLFFKTNGYSISHVGIYIGDQKMIHASTNNGVEVRNINERYYLNSYVTARRILNQEQYEKWATIPKPEPEPEPVKVELVRTNEARTLSGEAALEQQQEQARNRQSEIKAAARMEQNQKMKEMFLKTIEQNDES